jgi:hypothetical protein
MENVTSSKATVPSPNRFVTELNLIIKRTLKVSLFSVPVKGHLMQV